MGMFHPCTGSVPGFSRNAGFETERKNSWKKLCFIPEDNTRENEKLVGIFKLPKSLLILSIYADRKGFSADVIPLEKKGHTEN